MTLEEAAAALEQGAAALPRELESAGNQITDRLERSAREWSSGPLSSADLQKLDHPFARRHGTPQRDPRLINVQTGEFRNAWTPEPVVTGADGITAAVVNESPNAEKLEAGTARMFARPLPAAVIEDVGPDALRLVRAAIDRALPI